MELEHSQDAFHAFLFTTAQLILFSPRVRLAFLLNVCIEACNKRSGVGKDEFSILDVRMEIYIQIENKCERKRLVSF